MLLDRLGISSPIIFDVGGHRGETVRQYRANFPAALVYCFEPFPDSLAFLNKTFRNDSKTKVIPMAVSDHEGDRTLYINEIDATNSLLPVAATPRRYLPGKGGSKASIQVSATSIDQFMKSQGMDAVHILKMDIQGGELAALKGAETALKRNRVHLIYTEIMFVPHYENQPLLNDIWDFLSGYGYSLFDIYYLHRANNGQLRYADALFVSTDVRKNVIDTHP
jgi:FkbM family methyltransferase